MSRFVPAGTKPEDAPAPKPAPDDDAWAAAKRDVSSKQASKLKQQNQPSHQEDSKSLYETLQANKAAKQAEFEESIRLKNQFRALDEDDVDFLDAVTATERAKENAIRREDAEQLDAYRRQQATAQKLDAEGAGVHNTSSETTDIWTTRKRRKKEPDMPQAGLKVRKTSMSSTVKPGASSPTVMSEPGNKGMVPSSSNDKVQISDAAPSPAQQTSGASASKASALGLGAYSSDED